MNALSQVCASMYLMDGLGYGEKTSVGQDLIKALTNAMPKFNDTFLYCDFQNNDTDCHNLFSEVITAEGMCYSFNSLSPSEVFRAEG